MTTTTTETTTMTTTPRPTPHPGDFVRLLDGRTGEIEFVDPDGVGLETDYIYLYLERGDLALNARVLGPRWVEVEVVSKRRYRVSAGQSVCGGPIDYHPGDVARWCVDGAIEYATIAEAEAEAIRLRLRGKAAYAYEVGAWAPPPGATRLRLYSPHEH